MGGGPRSLSQRPKKCMLPTATLSVENLERSLTARNCALLLAAAGGGAVTGYSMPHYALGWRQPLLALQPLCIAAFVSCGVLDKF